MRAAVCSVHGPPESVEIREVDAPTPGPGQVVVSVRAAAVNFPDVLIVADRYQLSVPTPFVPGSEFAGEVAELGEGVSTPAVGDRVRGTVFHGAFAEQVVIDADRVHPIPDDVTMVDAAGFYVTHATAYHCLRSVASLQKGERLLVTGAAGGVGSAAVALGVAMGAEVVAVASGREKLDLCERLGASVLVDASADDLRGALRESVPDGIDVVLDPVGGDVAEPAVRACRYGARFVTVGFASGDIPAIPLNLVLLKGVTLAGFEMRGFGTHHPDLMSRDLQELEDIFASGVVRPAVGATLPLDEVVEALRLLADRRATGKIIIVP